MAPTDRVNRVHTPAFLQTFSLGFSNRELIADRVAPRVRVSKQSDKYRIWGKNGLMTHEARWHPGSIPNAIEMRWSDSTYYVPIRKLRTLVLDAERRNADSDLNIETAATELVTNAIALSREKRVADLFTTAGNYASANKITKAGGAEWDVSGVMATAQPLIDLMLLAQQVSTSAMVPISQLTVVIPEVVYTTSLWNNTAILDRVKYSATGIVTVDLLRAALGVKEVIFSASMSVGAGPEVAESDVVTGYTATNLWGDTVWIGLVNEGQNQQAPSFARSFQWNAETGGQDRQIRKYRTDDEGREGDWIECKEATEASIVFAAAGGIIINTLSTI